MGSAPEPAPTNERKVRDRLARTGLLERIGGEGIYFSVGQAVACEQDFGSMSYEGRAST